MPNLQNLAAGLSLRRMTLDELPRALDWAAAEDWNPGLFDAEPFHAADPQGFFLAEVDGQPVGCFSAVAYDQDFGFAGLLLVRREYRGRGIGVALARAGLDYLGSRTVGQDGVPAKQRLYARLGFTTAYTTTRFAGTVPMLRERAWDTPACLVDLRTRDLSELAAYDRTLFPAPREAFLEAWIRQPGTVALGILQLGRLVGYGVARSCRVGFKIGPLTASEPCLAEVLLQGLLAHLPGETVFLDLPDPNAAGLELVRRWGMRAVSQTARMYRGPAPQINLAQVFAVTSLELG